MYSYDDNLRQKGIGSADPFCHISADPFCHIATFRDRILELLNVAEQCLECGFGPLNRL